MAAEAEIHAKIEQEQREIDEMHEKMASNERKRVQTKSDNLRYWEEQLDLVRKQRDVDHEASKQLQKGKIII